MEQNKNIPTTPPTSGSNANESFQRSLDRLKATLEKFNAINPSSESYYDVRNSYQYLKGFYDATYNFMQTFTKLIDLEVLRNESK